MTSCDSDSGDQPVSGALQLSDARLDALRAASSDFEWGLIQDGEITFADYEQAAAAYIRCAKEAGASLTKDPPELTAMRTYFLEVTLPTADAATIQASLAQCNQEYLDTVETEWAKFNAPSESYLQEARDALGSCLQSVGVEIGDHPSSQDLAQLLAGQGQGRSHELLRCSRKVGTEFGLPGFFG